MIAVDGPAASGKGTIARALSAHFDLPHMDTGLLYRSVALALFRFGGDPGNAFEAARAAHDLDKIDPADEERLIALAVEHGVPCTRLGETGGPRAMVDGLLDVAVADLADTWELAIPRLLGEAG